MRSANQNDLSNALLAISQSLADRTQLRKLWTRCSQQRVR